MPCAVINVLHPMIGVDIHGELSPTVPPVPVPYVPHAVADFYILHAGHYFDYFIIFFRVQIEKFKINFSSLHQEQQHPPESEQ